MKHGACPRRIHHRSRPAGSLEIATPTIPGSCGARPRVRRSVALLQSKNRKVAKMDDSLPELGDLEREVMHLVWANAPITAEAVRERLSRPLKESTVRTVLRRLEDKGYTTH